MVIINLICRDTEELETNQKGVPFFIGTLELNLDQEFRYWLCFYGEVSKCELKFFTFYRI